MKFRTKLLCILAVPLMGLVSIAAFAGSDRLDTAQQTGELRDRIGLVAAGVDLVETIGREAATTARSVASAGQERAGLDEARVATDAAVVAWQAAVARAGATGTVTFTTAINRVRESIQVLPTTRQSLDRTFITSYEQFGVALNELADIVAAEATDTALARDTAVVSALAKVELATATEWGVGELLLFRGANNAADFALLQAAVEERGRQTGVFNGLARPEANADFRTTVVGSDVSASNTIGAELLTAGSEGRFTSSPAAWWPAMSGRMDRLGEVLDRQISALQGRAAVAESDAENEFRTFALIAGGIVILSVLLGLVLARSVSGPIRKLTRAAEKLASEQLPALVSGLKSPTEDDQRFLTATLQPLEVRSRDEIGQLAEAFNAVQTVAVDVAAEQAQLLRKGISDIFVNLARRNQVLIDRQIEYLDDIESSEDDPEQLAQLYRLDHLATRMRRNAESLLVLAGHEPSRKRTRPVALVDVVRAALGEVEDYERIDITGFDEVGVAGGAAVDLAHLLAELLENATHFSAPDTRIEVEGRRTRGGYLLSVIDHGIGMAADQLDEANTLLATPPAVGLAIGRSLGFTVVARLSARYGASVRLMAAPAGGIAAIVHLPARLVVDDGEPEAPASSVHPLEGRSQVPSRPAQAPPPPPPPPPPLPPVPRPVSTVPVARGSLPLDRVIDAAWEADLAEFQPADARAGNGHHDHNGNGHDEVDEGNGHPAAPPPPPLARRNPGAALPAMEPDRVPPEVTAAGLVRRVPKRSIPTETDPPQEGSEAPGIAASRRSPDDVRAMLARYRSGLQRGRVGDPAPDADTDPEEAS